MVSTFHLSMLCCRTKTTTTYNHFFAKLKAWYLKNAFHSVALSDFEGGIICSSALQLQGVRCQGCFYHFSQAVWEAVQNHGLQVEYTSNDELKILYRPTDGSGVLTRVGDLDILLNYFENTWLDGGQFSPAKRSVLN